MLKSRLARFAALALLPVAPAIAQASISWDVTLDPSRSDLQLREPEITAAVEAAGYFWDRYLIGAASLEVYVTQANIPTATGASATSAFVGNIDGYATFEQGAAHELRTGNDPNASQADIIITLGTAYLDHELWFDPDPFARTVPVPNDRTDAVSVFLHELGHALAFNGWRTVNGSLPTNNQSTFDRYVTRGAESVPFFTGPEAVALYGSPVPLTRFNLYHLGNPSPLPGNELIPDLMNGVVYSRGTRYYISALDLAITDDTGVPVDRSVTLLVPTPSTLALVLLALIGSHRRQPNEHRARAR
jgi:hypothetical protein